MNKVKLIKITSLTIMLFFGMLSGAAAQENATEEQPTILDHFQRTYLLGIRYNDYSIAKNALYDMLAIEPANDSIAHLLSYLYFQQRQYASAALIAQDVISRNPEHLPSFEIAASSLESLGALDKSLEVYERLYLKTNDFQSLYKIAFLQYDLKRFIECESNLDLLMEKKEADEEKVIFNDANNQQKEYPIKVALLNLKGLLYKEKGDKAGAKKHFEAALAIAPDFAVAKENLESLNK